MDPEQSQDSGTAEGALDALQDRLFGSPAEGQQAEDTQVEPEESGEEGEETQPQTDDSFEFTTDEGETLKVPTKLKDYLERRTDYTRKNQERGQLERMAQDKIQFAEAREQFVTETFEELSALKVLQTDLEKFKGADWASLYEQNAGQALQLQQRMRDLEREIAAKEGAIRQKGSQLQSVISQHAEKQWQMAVEGARQRLGSVSANDDAAMAREVQSLGFEVDEFRRRFADPRIIHAIHKAAKWDALQESKPSLANKVSGAPPVIKPGASEPGRQFTEKMQFGKAMKSAKSDSAKADLIGSKLANRFGF